MNENKDFPVCCNTQMTPIWLIEAELGSDGWQTGRKRWSVDYFVCAICSESIDGDVSFNGPWQDIIWLYSHGVAV
jgi:hypothetical protein